MRGTRQLAAGLLTATTPAKVGIAGGVAHDCDGTHGGAEDDNPIGVLAVLWSPAAATSWRSASPKVQRPSEWPWPCPS